MVWRILYFFILASIVGLIAWKVWRVYKEEKRNQLREDFDAAAANKETIEELQREVHRRNLIGQRDKDKKAVKEFIDNNKE